ncbi:MAG TPA: M12 family metallo-peptidase [Oligoflexia bacterium]|nr:M12 family metallo-peptidase [Oligoflexia bacterium]HMP26957.1 M12 family metallo-peptidase [Oligoflexia bacterium]
MPVKLLDHKKKLSSIVSQITFWALFLLTPINNIQISLAEDFLPDDYGPKIPEIVVDENNIKSRADRSLSSASAPIIKVLVLYTNDARDTLGSASSIENRVLNMSNYANNALRQSQTNSQIVITNVLPINESSSNNFNLDLDRLTAKTDGHFDSAHQLRDENCSDLVVLLVGGTAGGNSCGLAWLGGDANIIHAYKDVMFSVVSINEVCSPSTFAHEIAHNLGANHDIENAFGPGAYSYSYGYRFTGNSGQLFRDIMAYLPGVRINYFSNPTITYDNRPTGSPTANNALTIYNTAPEVAQFYADCGKRFFEGDLPPPGGGTNPSVWFRKITLRTLYQRVYLNQEQSGIRVSLSCRDNKLKRKASKLSNSRGKLFFNLRLRRGSACRICLSTTRTCLKRKVL